MINVEAIDVEVINTVDPGRQSMINIKRINSQLSVSHEKVIASVDGRGDGRPPETFRA